MTKANITLIQTGLAGLQFQPGRADGLFGPRTLAAARAFLVSAGRAAGSSQSSRAKVILIQTGLDGLGYAPGPVDGVPGPRTRAAMERWIAAGGIAAGAGLTPETTAMIYQGSARHPVHEIAVHCSATRPDWMHTAGVSAQLEEIRRWHVRDRKWRDIGYQWVIGRNGEILAGRAETTIGAGIVEHNSGVIHACLIGGHGSSETDQFAEHFTERQDAALRQLIQGIGMRTRITRVSGHNEYAAKACPGFNVAQWLKAA